MEVVKLLGVTKDYIWGGNKLNDYGKKSKQDKIAESWELSFLDDGPCYVDDGNDKPNELRNVVCSNDLGTNLNKFDKFPLLIKLIDAKENLSVQVHPSDEYALKHENSLGKVEMWYVLDADDDSYLHIGLNRDSNREEISTLLNTSKIMDILNRYKVRRGDCFLIPVGTIHCIGKGLTLIEIQSSSNITYRLFDYDRIGKDGKKRELHIEKGLDVIDYNKYNPISVNLPLLYKTKYFETYIGSSSIKELRTTEETFITFTVIEGNGKVNNIECKKGDTFFIPANKKAIFNGDFDFIYSMIP